MSAVADLRAPAESKPPRKRKRKSQAKRWPQSKVVRELAKAAESSRVKAGEYVVGFDATLREVNGRSKGDTRVELLFRVAEGPDTGTPLFMYLARPQQRHASRRSKFRQMYEIATGHVPREDLRKLDPAKLFEGRLWRAQVVDVERYADSAARPDGVVYSKIQTLRGPA